MTSLGRRRNAPQSGAGPIPATGKHLPEAASAARIAPRTSWTSFRSSAATSRLAVASRPTPSRSKPQDHARPAHRDQRMMSLIHRGILIAANFPDAHQTIRVMPDDALRQHLVHPL